ncbi:MAG: tripartite tricarboxylate transporter substrate binding protein [Pseudolabrys sp.]|nr:tripartite tricarboxylate transporter substrate binding protein [Pseudolabrys sp.]
MQKIARRTLVRALGGVALAGLARPGLVSAQSGWPNRPVRIIVPLAPGGAIDFVARQCGQVISNALGQQFFVENHTGAGGSLGMDLAMKATPDGYTFLITNDNAASAPYILKLPYDYTKTLLPVIDIAHQPQVFAVHPSLGVNSVKEFVENAEKNPGVGIATSGVGSNQHVVAMWFAKEAGIKVDHVPYRGAGAAVGDLIAGHVKSAFLGPTALIAHHKAGTIKIIAQTSAKRAPTLQDIPTLEESGYKGVVLEAWYAAFAPPGTPAELVQAMNGAVQKSLSDPKLLDNFEKGSLEAIGGTPDQLGKLASADSEKYKRLVAELGITAG